MDRRSLLIVARAMGEGVGPPVDLRRLALKRQAVAEGFQERDDPCLAGGRGERLAVFGTRPPALERLPVGAHVAPDRGDLVHEGTPGIQPEIGRLLARLVVDGLQEVGRQEPALDADGE